MMRSSIVAYADDIELAAQILQSQATKSLLLLIELNACKASTFAFCNVSRLNISGHLVKVFKLVWQADVEMPRGLYTLETVSALHRPAFSCSCTQPFILMQTKSYYMVDEEEPILEKAEGTSIQWSSGKDPTRKVCRCIYSILVSSGMPRLHHA